MCQLCVEGQLATKTVKNGSFEDGGSGGKIDRMKRQSSMLSGFRLVREP